MSFGQIDYSQGYQSARTKVRDSKIIVMAVEVTVVVTVQWW